MQKPEGHPIGGVASSVLPAGDEGKYTPPFVRNDLPAMPPADAVEDLILDLEAEQLADLHETITGGIAEATILEDFDLLLGPAESSEVEPIPRVEQLGEQTVPGFEHPTGRRPRSIVILGNGATQRTYAQLLGDYERDIPAVEEVWIINKAARFMRGDLLWVLDDLEGERRRSPAYFADVVNSGLPIMTTTTDAVVDDQVPRYIRGGRIVSIEEYPIRQVLDYWGRAYLRAKWARGGNDPAEFCMPEQRAVREAGKGVAFYLHNSVPYMLAYAGFIGIESVQMFGCDYSFGGERREEDRACAEYWVGMLRAHGVEVFVPSTTTLLNQNRQPWAYGYGARQPEVDEL